MILESLTCKSELSEIVGAAMDDFDSVFTSDICLAESLDQASPYHWSSKEVLDWVFKVAEQNCMDWKVLRAEAFKMKGSEFCFKNRQEFINLDPTYGSILYESLQQLLEKYPTGSELPDLFNVDLSMLLFDGMGPTDDMIIDNIPCEDTIPDGRLPEIGTIFKDRFPTADLGSILDSPISTKSTLGLMSSQGSFDPGYESTGSCSEYMWYSSSPRSQLPEVLQIYNNDDHHIPEFSHSPRMACSAVDYYSCHNATPTYPTTLLTLPSSPSPLCASPLSVNSDSSFYSSGFDSPTSNPDSPRISNFSHHSHYDRHQISLPTGPRKPGRPRKQAGLGFPSTPVNKKNAMGSRKRPQGNKSTHLWEFMRTLLDDPEYNPSCIKWENEELGVFRIVPGRSQDIARLWGLRKNNSTMTFDKLSRSLRWCRTYGFLAEVPKDKGYPKKLCFRFGAKALQWDKTKAMAILGKC